MEKAAQAAAAESAKTAAAEAAAAERAATQQAAAAAAQKQASEAGQCELTPVESRVESAWCLTVQVDHG